MNTKRTMDELHRLSAEEYKHAPKTPLVAVLDNVRSQNNIGSIFRTADAFRLEKMFLCGICCTPPNDEIHKTALGAEQTVEWRYVKDTRDAIEQLHSEGYRVFAVEQTHNSVMLQDISTVICPQDKCAVVFGHEVFGVGQEVIDLCDGTIEIPQYGTKHSLNVSVSAGIVLFHLALLLRP